jgi:hypothetical protein
MNKKISLVFAVVITGCTTTGHFKVPEGSDLYINKRPVPVAIRANGEVTSRPFFWTVAGMPPNGGIPYCLKKEGKLIKEGRLRAQFRPASLLWPPAALIYWPLGFNPEITYDLINDIQE